LYGDDRIMIASQIKYLDRRDKPAATPRIGREQRELVLYLIERSRYRGVTVRSREEPPA